MGQQYNIWENLLRLQPEFYKSFWQTAVMLGISVPVSVLIGGLLGVWLFTTNKNQIYANRRVNRIFGFHHRLHPRFSLCYLDDCDDEAHPHTNGYHLRPCGRLHFA